MGYQPDVPITGQDWEIPKSRLDELKGVGNEH